MEKQIFVRQADKNDVSTKYQELISSFKEKQILARRVDNNKKLRRKQILLVEK